MSNTTAACPGAERVPFSTSRLLEYFTVKELSAQIGCGPERWGVALAKELLDNALDAAEAAGVAPVVSLRAGEGWFSVEDNGPGIAPEVVRAVRDFSTRTSSNSKYVSPTRGQLGNALKCCVAAPFVRFGKGNGVTITTRGVEHRITVEVDPVAQQPRVSHRERPGDVKPGTCVRLDWPSGASCPVETDRPSFSNDELLDLAIDVAVFNPHAEVRCGEMLLLAPAKLLKWTGRDRTSAHWYSLQQMAALLAAQLHRQRQGADAPRSLRELVTNYAGLSGSRKAPLVLAAAGLAGATLEGLAGPDGLDMKKVGRLLEAMRAHAAAPAPEKLGRLGRRNLSFAMAHLLGVDPESCRYRSVSGVTGEGLPYGVEAALGACLDESEGEGGSGRCVLTGINWTPSLGLIDRRLHGLLQQALIEEGDPVCLVVHVVIPGAVYADTGKTRADLPAEVSAAMAEALRGVAAKWTQAKGTMARRERATARQAEKLRRQARGVSLKEAAYAVMVEAHHHVTGGRPGAPAHARQVMYAARKLMQRLVGSRCWKDSDTFTQGYLPDYVAAHPEQALGWNVVYDERGEMVEPHGGATVALGTLRVREYVGALGPGAPLDRFRFVLLVEKEGFKDLIAHARIAERFDVALAWTKGMSTTACRELVDELSGRGVTVLVLHDFDKAGLSIAHTICHDSRRYRFRNRPRVVDVGLRLADVRDLGLEGEAVEYRRCKKDPRVLMASRGIDREERDYLVREKTGGRSYAGRRVELNELTNEQFVALVERKLAEAGAAKVVPDEQRLHEAFVASWRQAWVERAIEQARRKALQQAQALAPPAQAGVAAAVSGRIACTDRDWRWAIGTMAAEALMAGGEDSSN